MDDKGHGGFNFTYRDTDSVQLSILDMYPETLFNIKPLIRPWYIRALYSVGRRLCILSVDLTRRWRRRQYKHHRRQFKRELRNRDK